MEIGFNLIISVDIGVKSGNGGWLETKGDGNLEP